jgi:hypothetical protein
MALAQEAFERTKLPSQGPKDAVYAGVLSAASWACGATSRGGDNIYNDGHALTKATADMCAVGPTGIVRFGTTRVSSCYELRMHVPAANTRYCATAAWSTRFHGFIAATWELAQAECAFLTTRMDTPTILENLKRCVTGSFAALCPLSRVEVVDLLTRDDHVVPPPPVFDNNSPHMYMFTDSIAECHTNKGKHELNRDHEAEGMGYPLRHYHMDVEPGMNLTSVARKVDLLIRNLNAKGVPLAEATVLIFWNGSEFCATTRAWDKDNTGIADLLRSEKDALAHLCVSFGKFGHKAVVGFSPSWRWNLHPNLDRAMSEVRAIFDRAFFLSLMVSC